MRSSDLIFKAYNQLSSEYKIRTDTVFGNQTEVVLPPLASTLLDRLPVRPSADVFIERMMTLRRELEPVRRRFNELQMIDWFSSASTTCRSCTG